MISVILCGGNGDPRYNLHKRAALALNCMAEILADPADEIIFVDYNTPDDLPTLPEAIGDTLTGRAREMLRVLRVRPQQLQARYKGQTPLAMFEPVARNIAVRRACSSNPWILSTDMDVILVPRHGGSFSDIVRQLPAGFYHAAVNRIERTTWERFDRYNPSDVMRIVKKSRPRDFDERAADSLIPPPEDYGYFQLLLRSDLLDNHGFEEHDLSEGHVHSKMAARLRVKYSTPENVGPHIHVCVCDDGRARTAKRTDLPAEDNRSLKSGIGDRAHQPTSWGGASDCIEEIRLNANGAGTYIRALRDLIGPPMAAPIVLEYTERTRNKVDYDPFHLLPFLADMFVPMPRSSNVAWYGTKFETARLFAGVWERLGFTGKILLDRTLLKTGADMAAVRYTTRSRAFVEADTFVFDFGGLSDPRDESTESTIVGLRRRFRDVVYGEQRRYARGLVRRRIIALNAIHNDHDGFVREFITAALTPFATHIRHGFVLPNAPPSRLWLVTRRAWQTLPPWLQRVTRRGWRMLRRLRPR